jgi:hypothetical protein
MPSGERSIKRLDGSGIWAGFHRNSSVSVACPMVAVVFLHILPVQHVA